MDIVDLLDKPGPFDLTVLRRCEAGGVRHKGCITTSYSIPLEENEHDSDKAGRKTNP